MIIKSSPEVTPRLGEFPLSWVTQVSADFPVAVASRLAKSLNFPRRRRFRFIEENIPLIEQAQPKGEIPYRRSRRRGLIGKEKTESRDEQSQRE
jgi:hypothetical protein